MRKDVFVVDPPSDETPGNYILVISRGGMFGSSSTAFAVDGLEFPGVGDKPDSIRGYQDDNLVVEFSPEASYIMIARKLTRPTNMTEIEIEDRRMAEEHKKVIEAAFPVTMQDAAEITEDGRQRINTQGYL